METHISSTHLSETNPSSASSPATRPPRECPATRAGPRPCALKTSKTATEWTRIAGCVTAGVRARLASLEPFQRRAHYLLWEQNYYPTRFPVRALLYRGAHPRRGRLNLPFPARDFDGAVFADER